MKRIVFACSLQLAVCSFLFAQNIQNNPGSNHGNKFEQLGTILPSPNEYRTASGAPGSKYWQQRVDYDIKCDLDESNLKLTGDETITYYNNSPDVLPYLWFQLDENVQSSVNNANYQNSNPLQQQMTDVQINRLQEKYSDNGYGFNIVKLTDAAGAPLQHLINKTMMRVELPAALKPGQKYVMKLDWNYKISDRIQRFGRGGYEYFPEDGNYIFTMSQWYPRLCMYSDDQGWQNHQFTGTGEFTVCFGNFKVAMTVPADYVVGATGEGQNYQQVLSPAQFARWQKAQAAKEPVEIVTLDEAKAREKQGKEMIASPSPHKKTWIFKADNVRDFAWGSSRKFVWDGMPVWVEGKKVMCMSYYAKEAYPIYHKYSTKTVAHTIKTYSSFTFPYPYPVAQSVEARSGMEYPMICFNPGRAEKDGTYSEGAKNSAVLVIIHEVGHNFFPMIVNSDERQWTWMDEGLNSFLQYLTQELWDNKFPSNGGPPFTIVDYMKLPKDQLEPIMTNSENIVRFGSNAYAKVATGLNILRETIMGRELFDYAFKEYAKRWEFKHPTPADFFRTLEDASGEDLDWFWRGWFYGTDPCDLSLDSVKYAKPDVTVEPTQRDTVEMRSLTKPDINSFEDLSKIRNRDDKNIKFQTDADTSLRDFYWRYDRNLEPYDSAKYATEIRASSEKMDATTATKYADKHAYELTISNKGGLVMPIIIEWTYKDGTKEIERIPAQVWRLNEKRVVKTFVKDKEVASIKLDPYKETADIDESNNSWGTMRPPSRFSVFKQKLNMAPTPGINPMQKAKEKKAF